MVTLLGVLSALSFGIGDFLARFSSKEVGFKNSLFWMLVVGALFYLILFSIFGEGLNPNSIGLSNSFLSGILIMFGLLCCLLYTSPSPRDKRQSRMPSSA